MKKLFAIAVLGMLMLPAPAFAHRLDEYLEATILSVSAGRVEGTLRLVPGVKVAPVVLAGMDTNGDGALSAEEQRAYALRVLQDVSLSVDGRPLTPRLVSESFPAMDAMQQGSGEIEIVFAADMLEGGANRRLVFENHHQNGIAVYLVNCLVPADKKIRITGQKRNENQSWYELDFAQAGGAGQMMSASFSGFAAAFRLGLRHIAEGTDHLLFLLALLLPAPLLAVAGRWRERVTVRRSLAQILCIVTAFTLGHSLTLALAAFGVVELPSRPVEVLIAVSILVSAMHALRPIFPGCEAVVAGFFGLIHGLAFASALSELGFDGWYRVVSVLGFNLGIEVMQLAVVTAMLPSLLLLSRRRGYALLRVGGALFAGIAAMGWIAERLLNLQNVIGLLVESVARHAGWIAAMLFLVGLFSEAWRGVQAASVRR